MPTISVSVPVYKVEKYIHRCVDSILAQTFTDFELILVDDGSPDTCGAICDEYAAVDSRVVVIHQANGGLSAARNAGIDWAFANSESQWLTFIDSDDWVHPEMLKRLLDAAVLNNVSISVCGYAKTQGEEPIIGDQDLVPVIWNPEDFFVAHNVNATIACAKLYRKECFQEIRYPAGKIHEDEFTTYRLLFSFPKTVVIRAPLYCYFQNPTGITGSRWNPNRLAALDAFEEQILYFRSCCYQAAYQFRLTDYFLFACSQIEKATCSNIARTRCIERNIRRRMRRLWRYNKGLPDYPTALREWVLAKMFPLTVRPFLILKSIIRCGKDNYAPNH